MSSRPGGILGDPRFMDEARRWHGILARLEREHDDRAEAVIATDLRGIVVYWNRSAERLYLWSRDEVIGHDVTDLTVGPEDEAVADRIMNALRASGRWEGDFWVRRKDGSRVLAHVTDSMDPDEDGVPSILVGVSRPAD